MNKVVIHFAIVTLILTVGVLADPINLKEEIKNFVEKKGINVEDTDIAEVNFSDLPDEVDIEKVENTSIVIYKVNYSDKPLFVIASGEKSQGGISSPVCDTKLLLHFGLDKATGESSFLNMANGVRGSLKKGYAMIRSGSITGISTNLEIIKFGGQVEIIIYKNGEEVGFRNILNADSSGVKIDYDTQSKGVVNFKAGDVLSVYLNLEKPVSLTDVTTAIEITN